MRDLVKKGLSRPATNSSSGSGGELREAAVLLPLIERADGITLLLAQRTQHLHHHPGQIGLPGGMIELTDANPTAAALREAYEEVGIAPGQVEVVGELLPIDTRTGFRITPVVGFVPPDVVLSLDSFEVESVFEVPLAFVLDAANYKRQTRMFDGVGEVSYYVLDYDGQIIWGATAQILVNFVRQLGVTGIPD